MDSGLFRNREKRRFAYLLHGIIRLSSVKKENQCIIIKFASFVKYSG